MTATHRPIWLSIALLGILLTTTASATPLYTARAGRTCDNCHSLPNTWFDPTDWWDRKCTLSCSSCHVDPSGGALRNVSGRYFARTTLPMYLVTDRPLADRSTEELEAWMASVGRPDSEPASGRVEPVIDRPIDPRPEGSPEPNDGPNFFRPLNHGGSHMAWLDGRYGNLNADPLLQFGGDLRLAYWSQGPLFFPMQADLHTALHPTEHLTFATTVGLRGRAKGFEDTADEDPLIMARDLWVMTHEWPGLTYVRAGRFMPAFGWRVDDHTAFTRRPFGMSQEDPGNRVVGAEVGFTGNYPYMSLSAFAPASPTGSNPFDTAKGFGSALSVGWRDMGWSVGGSGMTRKRPLDGGGDTFDLSLQASFNPWYYWEGLPLTWLGEVATGTLQRPLSGNETRQFAVYQALSWTVSPGVTLQARYDFWDPDDKVKDDEFHRPGAALELVPIEGITVRADARVGLPVGGVFEEGVDFLIQLHGWF